MGSLNGDTRQRLIAASIEAKKFAYFPYSKFRVGCAVLTTCGKIINGCSIDSISYGLTICAERTAYIKAVSDGYKSFQAVVVSSDVENTFLYPCGACRQFMSEFGDVDVICVRNDNSYQEVTLAKLLPKAFEKTTFKNGQKNNPLIE